MANSFINPVDVTRSFGEVLHQESYLLKNVDKQYAGEIPGDPKNGGSIKIRKPAKYTVFNEIDMTSNIQDTVQREVTLDATRPFNVGVQFSQTERTMNLDDYTEQFLRPAARRMARALDQRGYDVMQASARNVYKRADYDANLSYADTLQMNALLEANFSERGNRCISMGALDMADLVNANSVLFNDTGAISKQYMDGLMDKASGLKFFSTEATGTYSGGTAVSLGNLSANVTEGATSIAVTGGTASGTVLAGTGLTIAGMFAIDPETQEARNYLKTFVVAADVTLDGSGAGTITLTGPIYTTATSISEANVSALASSGAAVTWLDADTTAKAGRNIFAWDKKAITFASVLPATPWGNPNTAAENIDGVGVRFWADSDVLTGQNFARIDVYADYKVVYDEWLVSTIGKVQA